MRWMRRLLNLFRTEGLNRELDRELEFHIAERADELKAAGWPEGEAEREARRRLGNATLERERARDADVVQWLDVLLRDTRHAGRALVRSPGFTLVAVFSLALGIGANTAVFSLIEAVVLRPLPVPAPEELVVIGMDRAETPGPAFTNPLWEEVRDRQRGMSAVTAFATRRLNTVDGGEPRRLHSGLVSGEYFRVFGVQAAVGRVLGAEDDVRGCAPVAVLGHDFWQREYGGAASAVGRTLRLEGVSFEIVGATRAGFDGPEVGRRADVYVPLCAEEALQGNRSSLDMRSRWWLQVMGRRAPGVTVEALNAELAAMAPAAYEATVPPQYATEDKERYRQNTLTATPAPQGLSGVRERYGDALMMLMAGVGLVLLIACANVANLLLARATARERELAIRAAIGAGRARLSRQALTESLLLAGVGAALGLILARLGAEALVALIAPAGQPVVLDLALNARVLAFTTGVAVLTVLVFGSVPAWRAARVDPQTTMAAHGRGIAEGHRRFTLGKGLVAAQVALSLILLAGAGLLVGSLRNLTTMDPGFTAEGLLLAELDTRRTGLDTEGTALLNQRILERLRALPGVTGASSSALTPVGGSMWNEALVVEGFTPADEEDAVVWFNEVSAGYFATLETRFLAGRDFGPGETPGSAPVAIVSETVAKKFFGGDAVGATFRTPLGDTLSVPHTVVGVVEDAKYGSLREERSGTVYAAASQGAEGPPWLSLEIRSSGSPSALIPAIKTLLAEAHPSISVEFVTLSDQIARSLQRERMLAVLSAIFAGVALVLAVLGLYGILSYTVARRRAEIGVRLALGARSARVLRMVLGDASVVVAAGLAAGLVGAFLAGRLVESFLFGLEPADPAVLGGAAILLAAVALAAATVPAWRASRLDPTRALRED